MFQIIEIIFQIEVNYVKLNKKAISIIMLAGVVFLLSCATTPVGITSSNTPLHNKTITENLGKVEGESSIRFALLGLWTFGKLDIQSAIDDALSKKGGDAMINIKCYESYTYFLIGSVKKVRIEGEAVKIIDYEPEKNERKK
jgi:hypothetical protein